MAFPEGNPLRSGGRLATGRYGTRAALVLVLALASGAAAALAAMPRFFASVPHDLRRTRLILDALAAQPPALAVFGNSVAMNGIDAAALDGQGPAYNLSSPGQTPAEGFLYYQELPAATRTLVYSLSTFALEWSGAFNPQVVNAFLVYGYRPGPATLELLRGAFPPADLADLSEPAVVQRFAARWVIREQIDFGVRRLVRRDLDLDRAFNDLVFPTQYTQALPPAKMDAEIRKALDQRPPGPFRAAPTQVALLDAIAARARGEGREVLFALAPVHPRLLEGYGPEFRAPLAELARHLRAGGARVADATDLLEAAEFVDPVHPSRAGAQRWTALLAAALAEPR
jgi:hypothetical protein